MVRWCLSSATEEVEKVLPQAGVLAEVGWGSSRTLAGIARASSKAPLEDRRIVHGSPIVRHTGY